MQALRDLLVRLGVLSSRLEALPPQLQLLLSEGFLECRSAAGQLDVDPVAFYSADKTAVDVVSETASDVRHTLTSVGSVVDVESVMDAGSRSKEPIHWSTSAHVRRIASFNEGAFSSRDNVGGEHSPSPHRAASR